MYLAGWGLSRPARSPVPFLVALLSDSPSVGPLGAPGPRAPLQPLQVFARISPCLYLIFQVICSFGVDQRAAPSLLPVVRSQFI